MQMQQEKNYKRIANLINAREFCLIQDYPKHADKHESEIDRIINEDFPSGSGFDSGTQIDYAKSTGEKLVFITAFHHMEDGYYTHWTYHNVIVTPSLRYDFELEVTGDDDNEIIAYIEEMFYTSLQQVNGS